MEAYQIRDIINMTVDATVERMTIEAGGLTARISLKQAYKTYGKTAVEFWIRTGLIKTQKMGDNNSKVTLDRIELRLLSKTDNRALYFNSK
ncbi:MAG: hypothetical protein JWP44_4955 [Mucilaginibacter sp.]|nr:hypothetical protein [Mucilaginibacter sp.]